MIKKKIVFCEQVSFLSEIEKKFTPHVRKILLPHIWYATGKMMKHPAHQFIPECRV